MTQKIILRVSVSILSGLVLILFQGCEKDDNEDIICPSEFTDARDGQEYKAVKIGDQCWMAENLNVGIRIYVNQQDNGIVEKYCYDNIEDSCSIYGGLYDWNEAMQYVTTEGAQGICPLGWHIPTDYEWKILEGMVDSQYPVGDPEWDDNGWRGLDVGGNLKEAGTSHWLSPNTGATNSSGFLGLPGSSRDYDYPTFSPLGYNCYFWSSTQISSNYTAVLRQLDFLHANTNRVAHDKAIGFSVRCLKDAD